MGGAQQPKQMTGLDGARSMYKAYMAAADPDAYMREVAQRNPVVAQLMTGGGDLKQTFYAMCKQRGVDPQTVLDGITR